MNTLSPSLAKLAPALVAAQAELEHATKDSTNPHFRNTYASLTAVLDAVRPVLNKHGLAILQLPSYHEGITMIETVLLHSSGEYISGTAGARVSKDDAQGVGSAITYLRRYALAALAGIAQEDDDGQAASKVTREAPPAAVEKADHALVVKGRALWIEAAGLGLDQADATRAGMKKLSIALGKQDAEVIAAAIKWLEPAIAKAKEGVIL